MKGFSKNTPEGQWRNDRVAGLALLILLVLSSAVQAQFTYTTNSPKTTITITGYTGTASVIVIPSIIAGRTVTVIGASAFISRTNLTGVTIPDTVNSIGFTAFQLCSGLTNVVIPASVTVIEAFAFNLCKSLPNVAVPGGVTNIGSGPFAQCYRLTNIFVSATNPAYRSENGVLFDMGQTRLIQCPGAQGGAYVVPDGVVRIETLAFGGCSNLTSIAIPASVTEIGDAAFNLCTGLTSLTIPAGVATVGQMAFGYCTGLAHLYFCGNAPGAGQNVLTNANNQAVVHYLPNATGWPAAPGAWGNRPTALWLPEALGDGSLGVQGNQFGFNVGWAAGKTVVVDICTSLTNPDWLPFQTNVIAGGTTYFGDAQWTNDPSRFYRLRAP